MKLKKCLKMKKKLNNQIKYWKLLKKTLGFDKEILKRGLGLKILTPNQMLSRWPITLAQLNAGNNSEKLKNEIRQLLYSLYRSKNLQKMFIIIWLALYKKWKQSLCTLKIVEQVNHTDLN